MRRLPMIRWIAGRELPSIAATDPEPAPPRHAPSTADDDLVEAALVEAARLQRLARYVQSCKDAADIHRETIPMIDDFLS